MRLLNGRDFTERDSSSSTRVVIINESLARKAFGGASPIGRKVSIGRDASRKDLQVVGIVQDAKYQRLQETPGSIAYLPCAQLVEYLSGADLVAEIRAMPRADVRPTLSREVRAIDRAVPLRIETVADRISGSLVKERVLALLAAILGGAALALACASVFGLLAYAVSRQANEIGLRLALGASRSIVLRTILGEAITIAVMGIAIAIPAAATLGRFARAQLFEIGPLDPISLAGACLLMIALTGVAALLPALKASHIDPARALKAE